MFEAHENPGFSGGVGGVKFTAEDFEREGYWPDESDAKQVRWATEIMARMANARLKEMREGVQRLRAENDLLSDRFSEMNLCLIKYEKLLREARDEILGCGNHLKPSVVNRIDAALGESEGEKE